ncbi:hypothetical protein [Streptomyces sp. NPDC007088]|uniref:hypothetical protein n=1 Tax=Streptomyces sp. NPDC007088 TaxID=3364773 RepID=UPI0036B05547
MQHAQLSALGRALRLLGEHGEQLGQDVPDARLREITTDVRRALELLENAVEGPAPTTRCAEHPNGPVDESAVDGCLLCETRRRSARRGRYGGAPAGPRGGEEHQVPVVSRYGLREERPRARERWLPEVWNGQSWQLCGTPRHDRGEAERFLAAERRGPRPGPAYRLVQEFTDYEVVRVWGTPVRSVPDTMGGPGRPGMP